MSAKRAFIAVIVFVPLGMQVFSHAIGNGLMLLMDYENFIPMETSIFSLSPYVINEGSSAYWIYAEDGSNYYHFTYESGREYLLMNKGQPCPGFRRDDYKTWCDVKVRSI